MSLRQTLIDLRLCNQPIRNWIPAFKAALLGAKIRGLSDHATPLFFR